MPIALEGSPAVSQSGNVSTNSYSVAMPAGIVAGEFLLWAAYTNLATAPTTPSDWSVLYFQSGTAQNWSIYSKIATGSEAATSMSIANTRSCSSVMRFSGVNSTPLDVAVAGTAGTTLIAFPSVTPVTAGALILALGGAIISNSVLTTTFSSTNLDKMDVNGASSGMHTVATNTNAAAGIGREAWTSGAFTPAMTKSATSTRTLGVRIALRPAPFVPSAAFSGWGVPIK